MKNALFPDSPRLSELALERLEELSLPEEFAADQKAELAKAIAMSDFIFAFFQQYPNYISTVVGAVRDDERYNTYAQELSLLLEKVTDERQLHAALRKFRRQESVITAWRDLLNLCPVEHSLKAISALADSLIDSACKWLYAHQCSISGTPLDKQGNPMPMLIWGMGKLGGGELNFSSDVDLIFSYPHKGEIDRGRKQVEFQTFFTKLAQKLVNALHQQTVDGFVYRTDMRLRPFGDSGPLVVHFDALEDYYQTQGREWERFAMVKARVLGDKNAYTAELNQLLKPFVFRRYLDFSALESLRKMKRLIVQEIRRRGLKDNIKLGTGGIREVEFIVQAFQLIRGGRIPELQGKSLLAMLAEIAKAGLLSETEAEQLKDAYLFLRKVEHHIQQFAEQQTQTLPSEPLDQERLRLAMRAETYQQLMSELEAHMALVNQQFRWLISDEDDEDVCEESPLIEVWLSRLEHEETVEFLDRYTSASEACYKQICDFKQVVIKKSLAERGQEILDKLFPKILQLVFEYAEADLLLQRVIPLLSQIIRRTTYLELLWEHEGALKQLLKLCHASPWIADHLSRHPILLDELLDPRLLQSSTPLNEYAALLQQFMLRIPGDDMEAQMDALRQFVQIHQLRIAAADVSGIMPVMQVSDHLTELARVICEQVMLLAWHQMLEKYGSPETAETDVPDFLIVGYGKMGGIELGYSSDLDLVFLYDGNGKQSTTGEKSVSTQQFYVKMAQRMLHIFSARTSSGQLYDVDMRLRPSGESGLLVSHIDSYHRYLQEDAWIWEHQALTRARGVCGSANLTNKFEALRRQVLTEARDVQALKAEVIKMREKMREHLDASKHDSFDIKQGPGGIADIEFITQYLLLGNAAEYPDIVRWSDNIRCQLSLLKSGLLSEQQAETLKQTYLVLRDEAHINALANRSNHMAKDKHLSAREAVLVVWRAVFESQLE